MKISIVKKQFFIIIFYLVFSAIIFGQIEKIQINLQPGRR